MPGAASIGADLEAFHALVGVDHLHAEPVCRNALFVVQLQRRRDVAGYVVPGHVDDAVDLRRQGREGGREEIQVVFATGRALINDLGGGGTNSVSPILRIVCKKEKFQVFTMAVIELPLGPVTETQRPHSADSSQLELDSAVP